MHGDDVKALREIVLEAVKPVADSVVGLTNKVEDFRVSTAANLAQIQADVKHVRGSHRDLVGQVSDLRDDHANCVPRLQWPLIEAHLRREEDTAVQRLAQPTTKKSDSDLRILLPKQSLRVIPWFIVALLLGAAMVGAAIFGKNSGVEEATNHFTNAPKPAAAQE